VASAPAAFLTSSTERFGSTFLVSCFFGASFFGASFAAVVNAARQALAQ
jgi:hypothetical protein